VLFADDNSIIVTNSNERLQTAVNKNFLNNLMVSSQFPVAELNTTYYLEFFFTENYMSCLPL
jgi:hypothetical protein